jgi:hypothetical protein
MFFYLSVIISPSSIPFCLFLSSFSLYLSLCLYVSIWLSSFLFVSVYRPFLYIFLSFCLSVCKHLPIVIFFVFFLLSVCLSVSICLSSFSLYLSLCLSVSIFPSSFSLYLSFWLQYLPPMSVQQLIRLDCTSVQSSSLELTGGIPPALLKKILYKKEKNQIFFLRFTPKELLACGKISN